MNGYSIKTANASSNWHHLKKWVIKGKNEGEEWEEIDQQDNNDLNGPNYQHYYSIPKMTKPYHFIRIKCLGKNHHGTDDDYELLLTNFEIYGAIQENEFFF